jgi:hypothetical protein
VKLDLRFGPRLDRSWWMEILAVLTWTIGLILAGTAFLVVALYA